MDQFRAGDDSVLISDLIKALRLLETPHILRPQYLIALFILGFLCGVGFVVMIMM